MTEILGLNILEFVLSVWASIIAFVWLCDNFSEFREYATAAYRKRFPEKKEDPELTVEMPVGSFDPDETMKLPRIKGKIQVVHIMKAPEPLPRRRHARV